MNICKRGLIIICLLFLPVFVSANASVNAINSCLALVEFLDDKISKAGVAYSEKEIADIQKGLGTYSHYLKHEVIKVRLLDMYAGNKTQAKLMWKLFHHQKKTFIKHLSQHFSVKKIPNEYAVALRNCVVKARPQKVSVSQPLASAIYLMEK
ncbi:hypothetical protein [Marinomonas posidonica]|uniref:Uncharacterized protein n=1 Tax=Marinomonas posidonica (strain CECT 7376 / NCIMB 14433 / IVIA-Po-181) TaxID=491952 RepID=F6CWE1_MARPP|nr:hypothetical protein [Marinomonas posidonica]AEF53196.1 hypothetical protein Mar181_0127 [Marinomonas posidonica IVIA-Po-181]